ncbi:hypothetical protein UlMin_016069 [Ulmus minor]
MATLQVSLCSSSSSLRKTKYTLHTPQFKSSNLYVPNLLVDDLSHKNGVPTLRTTSSSTREIEKKIITNSSQPSSNSEAPQELYAILEIVADRVEMHKNIGAQRDNWNQLLLNSVNGMTMTASIIAALGAINGSINNGANLLALKLSSSILYVAATGILLVMNKIQPSQLAEEQRNASRLFKQLHEEIKTTLALTNPIASIDVNNAMQKVLALDKAYPLPLLGVMLEKFPSIVKPAVWWPQEKSEHERVEMGKNGWNEKLEEEMKEIEELVKRKDYAEYVRLSKMVLKVNKLLAICGPLLTSLASIGSCFVGSPGFGSWPAILGVSFGAFATVVNSLEHGGQVGMVFEMYRSSAGFYKHVEEMIESNLEEREVDKRENGELFEVKMALLLGRSLSELRELANSSSLSSRITQAKEEFASKLF